MYLEFQVNRNYKTIITMLVLRKSAFRKEKHLWCRIYSFREWSPLSHLNFAILLAEESILILFSEYSFGTQITHILGNVEPTNTAQRAISTPFAKSLIQTLGASLSAFADIITSVIVYLK
jgi:hypothetical protein